ncbi:MAG: ISL3 family transposase [Gemmatimonadaceae bacterium]|nr:ISL3 family transposase [Gemmatimonadaceae bacterium]
MAVPSSFCPSAAELHLDEVAISGVVVTVRASGRRAEVACPACGAAARRVHSRYARTLADLPWQGTRVQLAVTVRRFFCDAATCPRRIFAERLTETAARYARRTSRAAALLELVGFALGGRAGSRLAATLGLASAPGTVLARVRRAPMPEAPTPRVLGVDDWALRRGQRYGTVLVDLERRRVIDLLPDREAATFAAWLRDHPGVEIISRDRGGAYADGARQGAPDAVQVADRFHLVHNLVDAYERACTRHHAALRAAAEAVGPPPSTRAEVRERGRTRRYSGLPNNRPGPTGPERLSAERRDRRLALYEQVAALHRAGVPKTRIARQTGLSRRTVITWLSAGQFPERAVRTRRAPTLMDAYADALAAYYDGGGDNAAELARVLTAQGYRGTSATVRRALAALRAARPRATPMPEGTSEAESTAALTTRAAAPVPSPRQVAWLLRKDDAQLTDEQRAYRAALETACPALAAARALGDWFVRMLHARDPNDLGPWLSAAEGTELARFAVGIRRDRDAVLAALCFPWSNGQVEGQVHRIKLIKRTMFGRASFPLLRRRVLHAA